MKKRIKAAVKLKAELENYKKAKKSIKIDQKQVSWAKMDY